MLNESMVPSLRMWLLEAIPLHEERSRVQRSQCSSVHLSTTNGIWNSYVFFTLFHRNFLRDLTQGLRVDRSAGTIPTTNANAKKKEEEKHIELVPLRNFSEYFWRMCHWFSVFFLRYWREIRWFLHHNQCSLFRNWRNQLELVKLLRYLSDVENRMSNIVYGLKTPWIVSKRSFSVYVASPKHMRKVKIGRPEIDISHIQWYVLERTKTFW